MANKYTYNLPFSKEDLEKKYSEGYTQKECAEFFKVSQKVIWRAMKNLGIKARKAIKRNQRGEKNDSWKGNSVGYAAFHKRIEALKGKPKKCDVCGTEDEDKYYDWACLTGQYENPDDYRRMCKSCHSKYDKRYRNLGEYCKKNGR